MSFGESGSGDFRVLIINYLLQENDFSQPKDNLEKYYSDSAPSISLFSRWIIEFRCGRKHN